MAQTSVWMNLIVRNMTEKYNDHFLLPMTKINVTGDFSWCREKLNRRTYPAHYPNR